MTLMVMASMYSMAIAMTMTPPFIQEQQRFGMMVSTRTVLVTTTLTKMAMEKRPSSLGDLTAMTPMRQSIHPSPRFGMMASTRTVLED